MNHYIFVSNKSKYIRIPKQVHCSYGLLLLIFKKSSSQDVMVFKSVLKIIHYIHSNFPLIRPSFVKLTQLAQFDKTSHPRSYMELVIV